MPYIEEQMRVNRQFGPWDGFVLSLSVIGIAVVVAQAGSWLAQRFRFLTPRISFFAWCSWLTLATNCGKRRIVANTSGRGGSLIWHQASRSSVHYDSPGQEE